MVSITRTGDTKRRKANFPFRLYAALVSVAVVLWLAWSLWPPQIRVTRPTVDVAPDKIIVRTALTNRTSATRAVTIRFDFGYQTLGTDQRISPHGIARANSGDRCAHLLRRSVASFCPSRSPYHIGQMFR